MKNNVVKLKKPVCGLCGNSENLTKTRLVLDPVSITKAIRAKRVLGEFYAIKVNQAEAEALTGLTLHTSDSIIVAALQLVEAGVDRVFITLGADGVYYQDFDTGFFSRAIETDVINATGAGDAFTAAMIYGFKENLSNKTLVDFCIAASTIALCDERTIAADLNVKSVKTLLSHQF